MNDKYPRPAVYDSLPQIVAQNDVGLNDATISTVTVVLEILYGTLI